MDPIFTFISKLMPVTGKAGFVIALAAGAVYVLRERGIETFSSLNGDQFRWFMIAGLIGAGFALLEGLSYLASAGRAFASWMKRRAEKKKRTRQARLNIDHLRVEHVLVLAWCVLNLQRRIIANSDEDDVVLLFRLRDLGMLDDADEGTLSNSYTYWAFEIPDHVWEWAQEKVKMTNFAPGVLSKEPPWRKARGPHGWMGR